MRPARSALLLAALLCPAAPALAQAGLLVPTSTGVADPSVLSLREMAVDVGLARGYARVNVRQVFENHTGQAQEGTYRFALPPAAAVGDFAVWDDLVRIPAVILEKRRARAIYRELTRQRIDPGLLQQGEEEDREGGEAAARGPSGGALFSVSVAPIPAWGTKRLELQFQQEVPHVDGTGEFRLALRPPDGEPPRVGTLAVRVRSEDGALATVEGGLGLVPEAGTLAWLPGPATLDRDLVVRLSPRSRAVLRVSAFRNPEGTLPEGLALAPWERPSDVPPERDGFFLLEAMPPAAAAAPATREGARAPVTLAALFDTSLSHRWTGLESAWSILVDVLGALGPEDRFALVPFDREPAAAGVGLERATPAAVEAALSRLRARPLAPGTDVPAALRAARRIAGDGSRLLLLTDGTGPGGSAAFSEARGAALLFTAVTAGEATEAYRAASVAVLGATAGDLERGAFVHDLLQPAPASRPSPASGPPFRVFGGEPRLRDVYPVLAQPLAPGRLSGWVGRYQTPQPRLRFELSAPALPGGRAAVETALPERALEARDLPRRWARARVDELLRRIEAEGETREWVDEVVALSKRFKFATPYTAFLAAPRALLRPRRIQPGDPVLRIECDPSTRSAVALFPFGLRLKLVRRPGTSLWEGRFLVPEGLPDGRHQVRIVMRHAGGARTVETKAFVLDGAAPEIRPELPRVVAAGTRLRVAARTDADVVFLSARLGPRPPVPLRWDPSEKRSLGTLPIPADLPPGRHEVLFEAVDGARNHAFARTVVEVGVSPGSRSLP